MERTQPRQDTGQIREPDEAEITGWSEREYQVFMMSTMKQIIRTSPAIGRRLQEGLAEGTKPDLSFPSSDGVIMLQKGASQGQGLIRSLDLLISGQHFIRKFTQHLSVSDISVGVTETHFGDNHLPDHSHSTVHVSSRNSHGEYSDCRGEKDVSAMRMLSLQMLRDFQMALDEDEKMVQEAKTVPQNQICV